MPTRSQFELSQPVGEWLDFVVGVPSYNQESPQPLSGASVGAPAGLPSAVPQGTDAAESRVAWQCELLVPR